MNPTDPISYYLRHPMHCGVIQFLHWKEIGIVHCTHYAQGLENHPQPSFSFPFTLPQGGRTLNIHSDTSLPLATARKIWERFVGEGWELRAGDRSGVRMTGWGK
jgi:hypothetical protein